MPVNHELLARITAHSDVFGSKPIVHDLCVSVEAEAQAFAETARRVAAILGLGNGE